MAKLEIRNFTAPDETRQWQGRGQGEFVTIGGRPVGRTVFEQGWRWSTNVKPITGTDSCETMQMGYCVQGRMRVHMEDGTQGDIRPGDVFVVPPGHDAEVLGEEDCILIDFGEVDSYARPQASTNKHR